MASWNDVTATAPELATAARALFAAYRPMTLATLRKVGPSCISGIEVWREGHGLKRIERR